jgi:hypothetical protein
MFSQKSLNSVCRPIHPPLGHIASIFSIPTCLELTSLTGVDPCGLFVLGEQLVLLVVAGRRFGQFLPSSKPVC